MTRGKGFIGAAVLAATVAGCATSVPDLQGPGVSEQTEISREAHLISHIKCELRHAITLVERQDATTTGGNSTSWLDGWGAKISLKVQVDETGALAPNVTLTKPLRNVIRSFPRGGNVTSSQSEAFGLTASVNSHATRTETIGFYYKFADLKAEAKAIDAEYAKQHPGTDPALASCSAPGAGFMDGDLKIYDFMNAKAALSRPEGLLESPYSTFNYEIQFIVMATGSANPTWKLVDVSVNPGASLLNASRTKTNDLLITMGPDDSGKPSAALVDVHNAALIGQSVASALHNQN